MAFAVLGPSVSIVVLSPQATVLDIAQHPVAHRTPLPAFGAQPLLILEQVCNILCLLAHIVPDVLARIVYVDKLF